MAYPSFSSGEVLTAADMNAVGCWRVKEQTIGTTVSSVTVTDAFSADYDDYMIRISGGYGSVDTGGLNLTLGSTATGYYRGGTFGDFATLGVSSVSNQNVANWTNVAQFTTNLISCDITLRNPYLTTRTTFNATSMRTVAGGNYINYLGFLDNNSSYTAFTLTTASGTITGGTIRIYGYRS